MLWLLASPQLRSISRYRLAKPLQMQIQPGGIRLYLLILPSSIPAAGFSPTNYSLLIIACPSSAVTGPVENKLPLGWQRKLQEINDHILRSHWNKNTSPAAELRLTYCQSATAQDVNQNHTPTGTLVSINHQQPGFLPQPSCQFLILLITFAVSTFIELIHSGWSRFLPSSLPLTHPTKLELHQ